jgi:hypothetical protein
MTVAALYVDPDGVYANLPDVDLWDEARDARKYGGPWPVVAHPPCNKWSPLAYINQRRLPNYYVGDDGGCFAAALHAVRTWGGVLEHPALSLAWIRYELPMPARGGWVSRFDDPGYSSTVSQAAYGHRARKDTWLYAVGCELPELNWRIPDVTAAVSGFTHGRERHERRRVRPKEAAATPDAFRDVLLEMARSAVAASLARLEETA